jgi:hypothetical protein
MNIWQDCKGQNYLKSFNIKPWRVVEAQHILSSRDLVDTPDEHDLLEELLETVKPKIKKSKNYLIFTPFRYPPLKYGSRFGSIHEQSLWYGSLKIETAFTEVAFYQLKFFQDTHAKLGYIETDFTAFNTLIKTTKGIDLTEQPFSQFCEFISNKTNYEYSQLLGTQMRKANIDAFIYYSARTSTPEKNIGIYSPDIFQASKQQYVFNQQTWKCVANKSDVEFSRISFNEKIRLHFNTELFY